MPMIPELPSGLPEWRSRVVVVNFLVESNLGADYAGAKRGAADDSVRRGLEGRRERAIVADIVENSRRTRRPACDLRHQAGEGIGRLRGQGLQIVHAGRGQSG